MPSKASCPRFQIEIERESAGALHSTPSTHPSAIFNYRLLMMECTRERLASVDLARNQDLACVSQQTFRHLAMSLQAGRYTVTSTSAPCAMPACQVTLTLMHGITPLLYAGYLMIIFSAATGEAKMEEFERRYKAATIPPSSGEA
jgi:hypothetical protein